MEVSRVTDEYRHTYLCEFCRSKTYPTFEYREAEKHNASIGAFIIRVDIQTGEEIRRSVLCYQCMRKKQPEDLSTEDEIALMSFIGHEEWN